MSAGKAWTLAALLSAVLATEIIERDRLQPDPPGAAVHRVCAQPTDPASAVAAVRPRMRGPWPRASSEAPYAAAQAGLHERPEAVAHQPLRAFRGYEARRFQAYDGIISETVAHWNQELRDFPGYAPLDPDLVKAMLFVESGGSPVAWRTDPLQCFRDGAREEIAAGRGIPAAPSTKPGDIKRPRPRATPAEQRIELGVYVLFTKAIERAYNPATNTVRATGFRSWMDAVARYNGGGVDDYVQRVEGIYGPVR